MSKTDKSEKKTTQHKKENNKTGAAQADKTQHNNEISSVTKEQEITLANNREGSRGYNDLAEQQNIEVTYTKEPLW